MRKLLIVTLLCTYTITSSAQKIVKNTIDEFTKSKIVNTDYEALKQSFKASWQYRFRLVDNTLILDLVVVLGGGTVFSVKEGQKFMLKMKDEQIITLENHEYTITSRSGAYAGSFGGSNAMGLTLHFIVNKEQQEILNTGELSKIRLYTSDGYIEDEIKSNKAETFRQCLNLIAEASINKQ